MSCAYLSSRKQQLTTNLSVLLLVLHKLYFMGCQVREPCNLIHQSTRDCIFACLKIIIKHNNFNGSNNILSKTFLENDVSIAVI